jgi:hypothetical protein
MIEIENLTKYCGLSAFRYWAFPSPQFDHVPAEQMAAEAEPAPDPGAPLASPAPPPPPARPAPRPARAEPRVEPVRPMPLSVLGEVAAVLNPPDPDPTPAPAPSRSTRPARAARSAWRAATSPPRPR